MKLFARIGFFLDDLNVATGFGKPHGTGEARETRTDDRARRRSGAVADQTSTPLCD
jgi:hypothetical protein